MNDYKTILQETLENLEEARITQQDYLLNNAEIEHLLYHIDFLKREREQSARDVDMWNKKYNDLFDKWTELRDWLEENWEESQDIWFVKIINKMREISEGDE